VKLEGGKISKETIGNVSSMTQMTIGDEFHYICFFHYGHNVLKFKNIWLFSKVTCDEVLTVLLKVLTL
jgi:hypothetical protein